MIDFKVWNFPTIPISKQLFHVPGAAVEGGFTSGGARMTAPEPGGRSMLELQPAWQITEWDYPLSSWLMSKINGQIFRVRLAPTPQVLSNRSRGVLWTGDVPWNNDQPWANDMIARFVTFALEGSNIVVVDMGTLGQSLKPGHVIGHGDVTYMVDDISYSGNVATVVVSPPIRREIATGDTALFRSYFTGTISNGSEIRTTYDAENVGNIQIGKIVFNEVILP